MRFLGELYLTYILQIKLTAAFRFECTVGVVRDLSIVGLVPALFTEANWAEKLG